MRERRLTNIRGIQTRRCIVCADDYAYSTATSDKILELFELGAVNAASCLVETSCWSVSGERLRQVQKHRPSHAIGLHLNASERLPGMWHEPFSTARLAIDRSPWFIDELTRRFRIQWDRFVQVMQAPPRFLDGHQHVHLGPAARIALFRMIDDVKFDGWLRQCKTSSSRPSTKRLVLDPLSDSFRTEAHARGLRCNPGFGGLRRFRDDEDMLSLWRRDLSGMSTGGVLMVHPGVSAPNDPIGSCREQETVLLPLLGETLVELGYVVDWDARSAW